MDRYKRICILIYSCRAKFCDATNEEKLWRAVLCQMAEDAFNTSSKPRKIAFKLSARKWLLECDDDMREICILAGIRYKMVRKLVNKFIS